MKKLFSFRSFASSSGNDNSVRPPSETPSHNEVNDQVSEKARRSFHSPSKRQLLEIQTSGTAKSHRRSLSLSSAALHEGAIEQKKVPSFSNRNGSPSSSNSSSLEQSNRRSSRISTIAPERQDRPKCFETAGVQNANAVDKRGSASSFRGHYDSSESSTHGSSNLSNKVVDRFIDGEQEQEKRAPKINSSLRNHIGNENGAGKNLPGIPHTAPPGPNGSMKQKPRSPSVRETKRTQHQLSSRDWVENGLGQESPRRLAKYVIERLSQPLVLPKPSLKEFTTGVPITIEDIYGGSLSQVPSLDADRIAHKSFALDGPDETINGCHAEEISIAHKWNCFPRDNCGMLNSGEAEENNDVELHRKSKEAEERVLLLTDELKEEGFLECSGFSVPALIQAIGKLTEDRVHMAREVSAVLKAQISERASSSEELRLVREELDSRTRRLEKEKNELQSALEKELDRRSSDWSFKLEKYKAEENRLRERVRELAEQNVSLQRNVSSLTEREMESRSRVTSSELHLNDLTTIVEEVSRENQKLRKHLSELQENHRAAEEDRYCFQRNFEEKETECRELHRSICRLLRTCSEQEKTIDMLREGLIEEVGKKSSVGNFDKQLEKLKIEQIRLTGVEQALRKEVGSYRCEVDSLRQQNTNLLHRLKVNGKLCGFSTFKLDQELLNHVHGMQSQGLSLLNGSTQLCTKLLDYIKEGVCQTIQSKNGLDGDLVVESDMKVQGFKRGTESLTRSLQTILMVLDEKSNQIMESHSHPFVESDKFLNKSSEDIVRSELKAETLLTTLLREKLYSKEVESEQLQAELAAAVRCYDILKCEVQNALDDLSCKTHKLRDLELQMMKKDENINQLQNDLQECIKELSLVRGILPKVSEERDLIWEEVKQYCEMNMLLNSEIHVLKKKIEALDEDILLKEGQITILKDTLGKPFDLLS